MKKYEYKHFAVPFSDDQIMLLGIPYLNKEDRAPLDAVLEATLNEAGKEGWRVVPPLSLPYVLMERETDG